MWRLKTEDIQGHVGVCSLLVEHSETRVDAPCLTKAQGSEQRKNDTNSDSDGPTWIQTATGGDKPRTAGGTPTEKLCVNMKATEAKRGRQQ